MVGLVIGQQVHGVSPAMQRAQDEAEIRTLTAQVSRLGSLLGSWLGLQSTAAEECAKRVGGTEHTVQHRERGSNIVRVAVNNLAH